MGSSVKIGRIRYTNQNKGIPQSNSAIQHGHCSIINKPGGLDGLRGFGMI
jgi:hypothetical protein